LSVNLEEYESRLPIWREVEQEAVYTLREAIVTAGVKIHVIENRIKDLISLIGKAASRSYEDPLTEIKDIVGIRIVTLFLSDLPKIDAIINNELSIISKDDKTTNDDSAVGYRSIHYICTFKPEYSSPRYKKIVGQQFEIQVRTLCMHAWSAVSHYIEYKGDWDVPKDLVGSLKALSGLFHIADSSFEQFYEARERYRQVADSKKSNFTKIDLESVFLFLQENYPERRQVKKSDLSSFVHELSQIDITSLERLKETLTEGQSKLDDIESISHTKFGALGLARVCLAMASPEYRKFKYGKTSNKEVAELFGAN
jgi:putative GTP pyrophosphokinase